MRNDKVKELQERARKKYGGVFSHYQVYELPYDRSWV
jgi:hypothetical protein